MKPDRRVRWRWKIPTPVLVTLVGIALTAWLLPAFTRQWDDRQKVNELKAALIADMATASAKALSDSEHIWETKNTVVRSQAVRAWSLKSLELEARLRAYFSPEVVAKWNFYSYAVHRLLGSESVSGQLSAGPVFSFDRGRDWLDSITPESRTGDVIGTTGLLIALLDFDRSSKRPFLTDSHREYFGQVVSIEGGGQYQGTKINPQTAFASYEGDVFSLGTEITENILDAHARGYSTTKSDLIHDLLPL